MKSNRIISTVILVLMMFTIVNASLIVEEDASFQTTDGVTIYYDRYFNDSLQNQPLIVLSDAWLGDSTYNRAYLNYWVQKGYYVINVNTRGKYLSTGDHDLNGKECIDLYEAVNLQILENPTLINENIIHLTGNSGGGGRALTCSVKYPEFYTTVGSNFGPINITDLYWDREDLRETAQQWIGGTPLTNSEGYESRSVVTAYNNIHSPLFLQYNPSDSSINIDVARDFDNNLLLLNKEYYYLENGIPHSYDYSSYFKDFEYNYIKSFINKPSIDDEGRLSILGHLVTDSFHIYYDDEDFVGIVDYDISKSTKYFKISENHPAKLVIYNLDTDSEYHIRDRNSNALLQEVNTGNSGAVEIQLNAGSDIYTYKQQEYTAFANNKITVYTDETINSNDYYYNGKTFALKSENYNLQKVPILVYEDNQLTLKEYLGRITFDGCNEGSLVNIYKSDEYYTNNYEIMDNGYLFDKVECKNNKLEFYVDSFSSYTVEELSRLKNKTSHYFPMDFNLSDIIGGQVCTAQGAFLNSTNPLFGNGSYSFITGTNDYINCSNTLLSGSEGAVMVLYEPTFANTRYVFSNRGASSQFIQYASNENQLGRWYGQFPPSATILPNGYTNGTQSTQFSQVVLSWNSTGLFMFYNGNLTFNTGGSGYQNGVDTTDPFELGRLSAFPTTNTFDGRIDELHFFNESITPTEAEIMWNNGSIKVYPFVDPTPPPTVIEYTSLEHVKFEVSNETGIEINSDTYVLIGNFSFDRGVPQDLFIKGSGYTTKTSGGSGDLSIKIENGEVILDQAVATVSSSGVFRQFNIPVSKFSGVTGSNNIEVWAKENGNGAFTISNFVLEIDTNRTLDAGQTNIQMYDGSRSISTTSLTEIYNYTIQRDVNDTPLFIDSNIQAEITTDLGDTTLTCVYQNFLGINVSPTMERRLTDLGDIASFGFSAYTTGTSPQEDIFLSLKCFGSTLSTIFVNATDTIYLLEDTNTKVIGGKSYNTSDITVSSGTGNLLNATVLTQNSTDVLISFTANIQSSTGSAQGSATPVLVVNSTDIDCGIINKRSLDDSDNIGFIKGYLSCSNLVVNQSYEFDIFLEVPSDTVTSSVTTFTYYEVFQLDVNESILPIINSITNPVENETIFGNYTFTQSVSDFQGNGWKSELVLYYFNGTLVDVILNETTNENTTQVIYDTSTLDNGDYYIRWSVNDSISTSIDTVDFTVLNEEFSQAIALGSCPSTLPNMFLLLGVIFALITLLVVAFVFRLPLLVVLIGAMFVSLSIFVFYCWVFLTIFFAGLGAYLMLVGILLKVYYAKEHGGAF